MTNTPPSLVKHIGEQGLLKIVQGFCPAHMVGDDGAIFTLDKGYSAVVTTDLLVDGVHFSDVTTSAEDAGWRAAAANLSDLAAMGATGLGITVGLAVKGDLPISWVEGFYRGLTACLQGYNTPILGGDICRSSVVTVAIAAFGQVLPSQAIVRSAAQPGDVILVTGPHGSSRGGLELLLNPQTQTSAELILAHQRPRPRLDVLPKIKALQRERLFAGMDSSDGLADAVIQICRCSGVGAILERQAIPILPALKEIFPEKALDWALYGGEDFELVLCLPEKQAMDLIKTLDNQAVIIGKIVSGSDVTLIDSTGEHSTQVLGLSSGFQHFS